MISIEKKYILLFEDRLGKVKYSMDIDKHNGPNYYDCSSAVFNAMIDAGILEVNYCIGSTEDLFALNEIILEKIDFYDIRVGDIFVA